MTVAGTIELVAWILSAIIAGWLILDMLRVARAHSEEDLVNTAPGGDVVEPRSDQP